MLKNNNQAVIRKMAVRSIRSNRKKNSLYLVAIVLAVLMLFTVMQTGASYMHMQYVWRLHSVGELYDGILMGGVTKEQEETVKADPGIEVVGITEFMLGSIGEKNISIIYEDKNYREKMHQPGILHQEGRYPETSDEVMVTKTLLEKRKLENLTIGDTLLLSYQKKDGTQVEKPMKITGIIDDYEETANCFVTEDVFEQRMAALEGGVAALAVASGAAAITYTIENLAQNGDHIVSAKNIYGGSFNLLLHTLPQYGVTTTFVDIFNYDEVEAAIQENTKAIYIETLGNPNSDVVDIEALANIAHKHKIPLVVDNTFATPYLVRPIEYGADIVVHSATKFIGGHGTTIGGVIVDSGKFDWEGSGKFPSLTEPNPSYHGISFTKAVGPAAFVTKIRAILLRDTGATISPFHSFIFLQGLETLSLRVERHVENALKVVEYLNNHPQVEKVHHPSVSDDATQKELYAKYFPNGGGSIFTFEIKGDAQKAKDFIDNLELFSLLANVADVKSLVIHPATTTHSQCTEEELLDQGIKPNTIRLSIGTENIDDIIQDLDEAFKAVQD